MGLCIVFGLKFGGFVIARFLKFRETNDNGWIWGRFGKYGARGKVFVLFCDSSYVFGFVDSFILYSLICASKSILFKKFEKILQIMCVLRLLVGLLVYVLRIYYRFLLLMRKEIQKS